jgi:phage terminase small subunit
MAERPLTGKQIAFVDAYMLTRNSAESVRQAGYQSIHPDRHGYQLLRNTRVQGEIRRRQSALVRRTDVSEEWVIHRLAQTYELASQAKQFTAANRSLELIGRHIGLFQASRPVTDNDGYEITVRKVDSVATIDG